MDDMASQRSRYSSDSVERGLLHHVETGAVISLNVERNTQARPRTQRPFRVQVFGMSDLWDLTLGEAHALCLGLAASERVHNHQGNVPVAPGAVTR